MENVEDKFYAALFSIDEGVRERVREQLRRHSRINPNVDPRQVIDVQIKQEREKLERELEHYEEDGEDLFKIEVCELLINRLPQLAKDIKSDYR